MVLGHTLHKVNVSTVVLIVPTLPKMHHGGTSHVHMVKLEHDYNDIFHDMFFKCSEVLAVHVKCGLSSCNQMQSK